MKVKQFVYLTNEDSEAYQDREDELNQFLQTINFLGVEYSVVHGKNTLGNEYATGLVLVKYDENVSEDQNVVQMKQFMIEANIESKSEEDHKTIDDFMSTVDVQDVKLSSFCGQGRRINTFYNSIDKYSFIKGLALVVYKNKDE